MADKKGTDRPDDYKRFSGIDKEYDFKQILDGNSDLNKGSQTNLSSQTEKNRVAEKNYEPSDYKGKTQLERGLAETHEQVSDDYFEGTIDQELK
ncbi:YozQ family protein [Gracilibacillus xinjiangensis]|uniref:YozQ family protein n=1 Tax=Gracilibacillus xinjiangensis TaxID=1193282 RepID=A0ABV8WT24_9BACI